MSGIEIQSASEKDIPLIRKIAEQIFPQTYEHIVEPGQVEYMMDMIYSAENLEKQISNGQQFLILYNENKPAGFAAYSKLNNQGYFKLNKIYLDLRQQGKGLGKILLQDIFRRVREEGGQNLQLNVNRYNKAIGFYRNIGFDLLKEELLDIGGGYFMDDYVMQITV